MNHLNIIKRGGKRDRATRMNRKYIVAYVCSFSCNLELNSAFEYESESRDDSNIVSSALGYEDWKINRSGRESNQRLARIS